MSTFLQLREVIASTLKVPPAKVTETTRDEDLPAWDSLGHVNLMMGVEQTFNVTLDIEDFSTLNSVPAILDYLARKGVS